MNRAALMFPGVFRAVREQLAQVAIVEVRVQQPVVTALALVVGAERLPGLDRLELAAAVHEHRLVDDLDHQRVHVFQLLERRPVRVLGRASRSSRQPYREGLGEVLVRMTLRVPAVEMEHVAFAVTASACSSRGTDRRRAEHRAGAGGGCGADTHCRWRARLRAGGSSCTIRGAPFDLEHLCPLQLLEPGMCQVEGNRHAGNAIGVRTIRPRARSADRTSTTRERRARPAAGRCAPRARCPRS